jgi:hypothetical protein
MGTFSSTAAATFEVDAEMRINILSYDVGKRSPTARAEAVAAPKTARAKK